MEPWDAAPIFEVALDMVVIAHLIFDAFQFAFCHIMQYLDAQVFVIRMQVTAPVGTGAKGCALGKVNHVAAIF